MREATLALAAAALAATSASAAVDAPPAAERQRELMNLLEQDCGSCHGLTRRGGLGPALLPARLQAVSDEVLIDIILEGVPGTPMPPWSPLLERSEARWLVERLREGPGDAR